MANSGVSGEGGARDRASVLALAADLIFASRIRGAAAPLGIAVVTARNAAELVGRATELGPRLILVDLDARPDPAAAIRWLKAEDATRAIPVVAFVAHTNEAAIRAARDAGADRVMARSAFVRDLPSLLAEARG